MKSSSAYRAPRGTSWMIFCLTLVLATACADQQGPTPDTASAMPTIESQPSLPVANDSLVDSEELLASDDLHYSELRRADFNPYDLSRYPTGWRMYSGPLFDVMIPPDFTPQNVAEEDGMTFVESDAEVTFYVFSPMFNGEPRWSEKQENEREEVRKVERSGRSVIRRFTYIDINGEYRRSFEDIEDTVYNWRRVFGIRYTSPEALNKHHRSYKKFKQSLIQYADC